MAPKAKAKTKKADTVAEAAAPADAAPAAAAAASAAAAAPAEAPAAAATPAAAAAAPAAAAAARAAAAPPARAAHRASAPPPPAEAEVPPAPASEGGATAPPELPAHLERVPDDPLFDGEYLEKYFAALDEILAHPEFRGIVQADPLGIGAGGGYKAPFSTDAFATAMASEGRYESGCVLFWLDLKHTNIAGVPYNERAIKHVMSHTFANPAPFPKPLVVELESGQNPLEHKGALKSISAEETWHAWVFAVHRDLAAKPGVLLEWRKVATPYFSVCAYVS